MKIKNNITLLLLLVWRMNAHSQQIQLQKDTFYFVTVVTWLDNGRPMTNFALIKSLDTLRCINIDAQDKFICDFYESAIVSEDPGLVLDKNFLKYRDSVEIFRKDINKSLLKINKNEKKLFIRLKDNQTITLYICKIFASFWKYPMLEKPNINHSFPIHCYDKNYFLSLKKVNKCLKVKNAEIRNIKRS